jgi:hypothetical protein
MKIKSECPEDPNRDAAHQPLLATAQGKMAVIDSTPIDFAILADTWPLPLRISITLVVDRRSRRIVSIVEHRNPFAPGRN